jgi:hypothetical protein
LSGIRQILKRAGEVRSLSEEASTSQPLNHSGVLDSLQLFTIPSLWYQDAAPLW